MQQMGLHLLGHFEVSLNGTRIETFRYSKMGALLAYLAVEADRPHRRENLAEFFWPDRSAGVARANLRQALLGIRQAIHDHETCTPLLKVTSDTIQINRANKYRADVALFNEKFQALRTHSHEEPGTCQSCMKAIETAAGLYRGDFLDGMNFDEETGLRDWVQFHRRNYFRQQLEALQYLTDYYLSKSQYDVAYQHALCQLKMDPAKESAHRQMMRLLALTGRRSAAIEQYQICCRCLSSELGIDPEPETVALYEQIKAGRMVKDWQGMPSLT
jgi:DNA-binding SARP family transcriptional activator